MPPCQSACTPGLTKDPACLCGHFRHEHFQQGLSANPSSPACCLLSEAGQFSLTLHPCCGHFLNPTHYSSVNTSSPTCHQSVMLPADHDPIAEHTPHPSSIPFMSTSRDSGSVLEMECVQSRDPRVLLHTTPAQESEGRSFPARHAQRSYPVMPTAPWRVWLWH